MHSLKLYLSGVPFQIQLTIPRSSDDDSTSLQNHSRRG